MGYLEVLRPPEIDDNESSGDVVATEGDRATLKCVANGHPKPSITWVRENAANIMVTDGRTTTPSGYQAGGEGGWCLGRKSVYREREGEGLDTQREVRWG